MLFKDKPWWIKLLLALGGAGLLILTAPLGRSLSGVPAWNNLSVAIAAVLAAMLPPLWALSAPLLALFLGLFGLPVLSGGNAGLAFFLSGAGGFLLTPLLVAGLGGIFLWLNREEEPLPARLALGLLVAIGLGNLLGTLWMVWLGDLSWATVLGKGTIWLFLGDLFRVTIGFSVFFFIRYERRKAAYWRGEIVRHQKRMLKREEFFDRQEAVDYVPHEVDDTEPDEKTVEKQRRSFKEKEKDDLPPYFRM
ncbi:biotin transporter BioY [bacterium]|nr:biotin transporter BioY [bacterium]